MTETTMTSDFDADGFLRSRSLHYKVWFEWPHAVAGTKRSAVLSWIVDHEKFCKWDYNGPFVTHVQSNHGYVFAFSDDAIAVECKLRFG